MIKKECYFSEQDVSVGILGGTFNPIHDGHLRLAESIREEEPFDKILFVPAYQPPHKNGIEIVSFEKRVQMIEAGISSNPNFKVSRIEAETTRLGKSYSFDLIQALKEQYPKIRLTFLLGFDSWITLNTWYRYEEILGLCDFLFVCQTYDEIRNYWYRGPRKVYSQLEDNGPDQFRHKNGTKIRFTVIPTPKFRATDIRQMCQRDKSCRYLVPEPVFELINKWKLYK